MRHAFALVCVFGCGKSSAPGVAADAASPAIVDAAVSLVDAGVPDTRLFDLLTRADKVEGFSVNTSDFMDAPVGDAYRLGGYRITSKLGPPASPKFTNNLAGLVLADGAYRGGEAVKCALGPAVGIRWTRGSDTAEAVVMTACPSVNLHSTIGASRAGQLDGATWTRVFALTREAYPAAKL